MTRSSQLPAVCERWEKWRYRCFRRDKPVCEGTCALQSLCGSNSGRDRISQSSCLQTTIIVMSGRAGGLYGGIQFTTAKPFANQETLVSSSSTSLKSTQAEGAPPEQQPTHETQPLASGQTPADPGLASAKASAGIASLPEQKDIIQSELNHVSSNIKDGLLLLRSPQCDATLSRSQNPLSLGYQVPSLGGRCHQRRPFPPLLSSSLRLHLPKPL